MRNYDSITKETQSVHDNVVFSSRERHSLDKFTLHRTIVGFNCPNTIFFMQKMYQSADPNALIVILNV